MLESYRLWPCLIVVGLSVACAPDKGDEGDDGERDSAASSADELGFVPIRPRRVLDSRASQPLASSEVRCIQIAGRNGIPSNATAAFLNVTAVSASGPGFLTVFPAGQSRPETSNVNYVAGATIANGSIATLGDGGAVCIYAHRKTHVVVDVSGHFAHEPSYSPLGPYRRHDSREHSRVGARETRCLRIAGRDGVPTDASAVSLNLTAVGPSKSGFVTAYPKGVNRPTTSNLNFAAGAVVAGSAIVKVGQQGEICFYTHASTDLVVDVSGFFEPTSGYRPLTPVRLRDTRTSGIGGDRSTSCFRVAGRVGVANDAKAVALTVTATMASGNGFLTLYPEGAVRPATSNLNYAVGQTIANGVIAQIGNDGFVCVYVHASSHVIVDVAGYWRSNGPRPSPSHGWNYNLTRRCARSVKPGAANYYEDETDCDDATRNWTIAVQSERTLQETCSGPKSQSLPVNAGGPLSLFWQPGRDEWGRANQTVVLKTNFIDHQAPCGAGTYTWFTLMDHAYHGGGPFPSPERLVFEVDVWYDDYTPNGGSRAIVAWNGEWNGTGIQVEIALQHANWGDAFPNVPDIIQAMRHPNFDWVSMDGRAMGISIPRQRMTRVRIDWAPILSDLVRRGYLDPPTGGLAAAKTTSVNLAIEVRNDGQLNTASAEMRVKNYRVLGR